MPPKTCPNKTRAVADGKESLKVCGADLTEAAKVRGSDLVRCPKCGKRL